MLTSPEVLTAPRSTEIHEQQGLLPPGGAVDAT